MESNKGHVDLGKNYQESKYSDETKPLSSTKPRRRNNAFTNKSVENKDSIKQQSKEVFTIDKDDIMLIPELEDEHRDDDPRVAHAPIKFNQQLPTLKELNAASCHSDLSTYEGIDLSALTRCLLPLSQLEESESAATEIWTFESLLRDITDDLIGIEKSIMPGHMNKSNSQQQPK